MNKILCLLIIVSLLGCAVQTEPILCSDEQIKDLLEEFSIHIPIYNYIKGDCTGWGGSKKATLQINDVQYSLATIHRSAPHADGVQLCFTTEKENDPLFIDARNQICEKIKKFGFEQEYINCKQGDYDSSDGKIIHLKFGSTNAGEYFSQANEECMKVTLPS